MNAIPIINDSNDINKININVNTNSKFKSVGATGPTGPTGPALTIGEVTTNILSYDKSFYNLKENPITIDNILNYKQAVINSFKNKIVPNQDFHGYDHPWNEGKGKNLFNKEEHSFTLNQYINRINGTVGYNSDFAATDYIPIPDGLQVGDYITISPLPMDQLPGLAFYNNNYIFISGSKGQGAKIPPEAVYIRFCVNNEYVSGDLVQLEKGTEITDYVPYSNICPFEQVETVNIKHESNTNESYFNLNYDFHNYGGYINGSEGYIQYGTYYESYNGEELLGEWISSHDNYSPEAMPSIGAEVIDYGNISSTTEIARMNLILPHVINIFTSSNGILIVDYEEYNEPTNNVSITTDDQGKANFDFQFTMPIPIGPTGHQGIQGPTGATGNGISNIELISTSDVEKTYQINFTDGDNYQFIINDGITGPTGPTGKGFAIERTYSSIAAMNADVANVPIGTFVIIASNVQDIDDAKLYVRNEDNGFTFLTDLSGAQGIQGPTGEAAGFDTPEAAIIKLSPDDEPTVLVDASGDATNKKFSFLFGVPQGSTGPTGPTGPTGAAAGFNNISATINKLSPDDEPTISVTTSGDDTAKNFNFNFNIPQGVTGPTGPKGNVIYATFDIDLTTGHLMMHSLEEYEGPDFQVTNDGKLEVII